MGDVLSGTPAELLSRLVEIVLINIALSGDNALVIGMAAHQLPPGQRRAAVLIGGGGAVVLRAALTIVASLLLALPGVKLIGGVLLLWIGFNLLQVEEAQDAGVAPPSSLRRAIGTILLADLVMSLDNVLGVAAAAGGDTGLLILGLVMSMAIVIAGGGLTAGLMDRLWWLAYLGAAVVGWTGADMALDDNALDGLWPTAARQLVAAAVTLGLVVAAHLVHGRRRPSGPGTSGARVASPRQSGAGDLL